MNLPVARYISLGAGRQSSTLLLLAAEGVIPKPDAAVFADTGWEPRAVYRHLERLEREVAEPAGIPILRVSAGNIRDDALDPNHQFVSMPTFTIGPCTVCIPRGTLGTVTGLTATVDGKEYDDFSGRCPKCKGTGEQLGMGRRQCTNEYKLRVIKTKVRELLGYPHPTPVPRGVFVEQAIGFSRDEIGRVNGSGVQYLRSVFPLLDLDGAADGKHGWTVEDCKRYLRSRGFRNVPKSACIGCPYTGNVRWRQMRDERPDEWADAVDFDRRLRLVPRADGIREFLHPSRLPLDQAPIDRVSFVEWKTRQTDIFAQIADAEVEAGAPDGCSPWGCRSGQPVVEAA